MTYYLRNQWEANALAYTQLINKQGTPYHQEILNPCIEQLMGNIAGLTLLDAGCGEGYLSRFYARKGAKVVGIDFSPRLIDLCKKEAIDLDIKFLVGNICKMDMLDEGQFDIVLCNLVLLNIDCFEASLNEFYRVLRWGGFLIFSIVHPAFNIYGPGRWKLGQKDKQTGRRKGHYFVNDQYFREKEFQIQWESRTGEKFPQKISFFHRTISTYIHTLLNRGFLITAFEEPLPVSEKPFFERERRIPLFLVVKAMKAKGIK